MADDGYVAWHQAKLWKLLPAIYRTLDAGDAAGDAGPLRELVNRIGAQTAVIRRDIDRLWENQSIETCDDWVIPYIGDLLATRLVSSLDARAQRVDVARTIYYRRRAGTLGLLEELAANIAGRDARCVEFFRRLGRTRHQFDPAIGPVTAWAPGAPPSEAVIQALAGAVSGTPAGGFADLRKAWPATSSAGAFDEYAHTADLRRGSQSGGWHNISHLGVFVWWLQSFPIQGATPVSSGAASPCYTFDPTGRDIPLFAPTSRNADSFGEAWISPDAFDLPVPVTAPLWETYPDQLWPAAFWVGLGAGGTSAPLPATDVTLHPHRGRFSFTGTPPAGDILTGYHFGFSAMIGAGGFDSRFVSAIAEPPLAATVAAGASLDPALAAIAAGGGALQIKDSQTYQGPAAPLALPANTASELRALNRQRPVIRWTGAGPNSWTLQGGGGGDLILQGLWLQGADLILAGDFETVHIRLCTLDPGTAGTAPAFFDTAIDATPLAPTTLWVEGTIRNLIIERSVTGPIRTRGAGAIETLTASDSIIQAIATAAGGDLALEGTSGDVELSRCTVLGPARVHRLSASECILDEVVTVEDTQHGCVRFCAWADGSVLHAPYRSVRTAPRGPVFRSRRFGDPQYARLFRLADAAILKPAAGDSILGGARNGAEIGAFCLEAVTLKKRGLAIKFEEYAPLGVFPVWIDAD